MAYIVGLVTADEEARLRTAGVEIMKAPDWFDDVDEEEREERKNSGMRMLMIYLDVDLIDLVSLE